jgi:hypothetical protein
MFFDRGFARIIEYIDGLILTVDTAITDAITACKDYADGLIATLTTYVNTSVEGRLKWVARGDAGAYDFVTANFTADSAAHTLSLASIVPADAKLVQLRVAIAHATPGKRFYLFKVGYTGYNSVSLSRSQASNIDFATTCIVECTGQQIAYWAESGTWANIGISVIGWFLQVP